MAEKTYQKCEMELKEVNEVVKFESVNNNNIKYNGNGFAGKSSSFAKKARVDIEFQDIRYQVREWTVRKPIPVTKEILKGINGQFLAGELTAIMGPSGAGKSTLLNVLAAYTLRGSSGSVRINGKERDNKNPDKFKRLSCYIQQDDRLRLELTVGEAMMYTADLKLGNSVSKEKKIEQIKEYLEMLGLSLSWDTKSARLSGGQKKRLSVALELISNPPIIFLDEPTTGLDSSSCYQCVSLLKFLAQQGRAVVCTIHQPSALLFEMFDHLYALTEGRCIYSGSVSGLIPYLAAMNLPCPQYHNPADFLLDVAIGEYCADVNTLAKAATAKCLERLQYAAKEKTKVEASDMNVQNGTNNNEYEEKDTIQPLKTKPANLVMQFWLLYCRKLLILRRKPGNFLIRAAAHLFIGLLFGYLYGEVGYKADTVLANYVYLYGSNLFLVYTGKMSVTLLFPYELWNVTREHFNQWYKLGPYYVSMLLVEVPFQVICSYLYLPISYYLTNQPLEWDRFWIFSGVVTVAALAAQATGFLLGITTPQKIAVFIGPVFACLLSVFGFCIRYVDTPDAFKWLYHISYFRASFQTSVHAVYGYNRSALYCPEEDSGFSYCHFKSPTKFLSEMDMISPVNLEFNFVFILCWAIFMHILTVITIWWQLNKK